MEIRKIKAETITNSVKELFLNSNFNIGSDISAALEQGVKVEQDERPKNILCQLIENNRIAAAEKTAICQDTGMAVVFVEYGDRAVIENGSLCDAINEGVRQAYKEGYLRKSVVSDPIFDRKNTEDNTPCIIHTEIVSGDKIKITGGGKGFGSENMSAIKMLSPGSGAEGVKSFVLEAVKNAGPNPCPPIVIGVGVGGTFEKAAELSKKAVFRRIDSKNENPNYAKMEAELLLEINRLGIGPAGLGGKTTALGVNIEYFPTHIAGLPVAVNISCHASRHGTVVV